MPQLEINAHDAFALLEKRILYRGQLKQILVTGLEAKSILCLSDTTDVLLDPHESTPSIAHTLQKEKLGPQIEITQSDFLEFDYLSEKENEKPDSPRFGAHLPQQEDESRRIYRKVDSNQLQTDLKPGTTDVILGKNCMCNCAGGDTLCGGIGRSVEAQQNYMQKLINQNPSLIVLSASSAMFFPENGEPETAERKRQEQLSYKETKQNMIKACQNLNAAGNSPYRFMVIEPDRNLKFIATDPLNENGYMIVGYDTRKIDFQTSTSCLKDKREQETRMKTSTSILTEQHKKNLAKVSEPNKENTTTLTPIKLIR